MNFITESERVYVTDDKEKIIAEINFPAVGTDTVDINHTFVDSSLRGQGIAAKLIEHAYNEIKRQNKRAIPTCSYVLKWFSEHEEYNDILREELQ